MHKFRKYRVVLLAVLIVLVLGFGSRVLAADIILNDLNGKPVNLSRLTGKPVILFFWTTWCPSCRKTLNSLNQQYAEISKEGIIFFGVDVAEPVYKTERFFKGYALNFNVLLDVDGELADKYGLIGVPTFIFLNKDGKMVAQTYRWPANYKSLLTN